MVSAVLQPHEAGEFANVSSASPRSSSKVFSLKKKKMVFDTPRLLEESELEDPHSLRSRILRSREPHGWSAVIENKRVKKDVVTMGNTSACCETMLEARPFRGKDQDFMHEASLWYGAISRCNGLVTERGAVDCLHRSGIRLNGITEPSDKELDLAAFTSLLRRGMKPATGPTNRTLALRKFQEAPEIKFDFVQCLSSFQDCIQEVRRGIQKKLAC